MEDHSYEATPEERGLYEKSWHISLNKEGTQGPMRQRPDFRERTRIFNYTTIHVESAGEGNSPIHPEDQARHHRQQFEGFEEYNYTV